MPVNFLFRLNQKPALENGQFLNEVWNRLSTGTEAHNLIACRATPSSGKLTRFVIIYRNRNEQLRGDYFKLKFTIQDFELPIVGQSSLLTTSDKINKKTWYVKNEEELLEIIKRTGVSPADFNTPEFCNYPF